MRRPVRPVPGPTRSSSDIGMSVRPTVVMASIGAMSNAASGQPQVRHGNPVIDMSVRPTRACRDVFKYRLTSVRGGVDLRTDVVVRPAIARTRRRRGLGPMVRGRVSAGWSRRSRRSRRPRTREGTARPTPSPPPLRSQAERLDPNQPGPLPPPLHRWECMLGRHEASRRFPPGDGTAPVVGSWMPVPHWLFTLSRPQCRPLS